MNKLPSYNSLLVNNEGNHLLMLEKSLPIAITAGTNKQLRSENL